MKKQKILWYSAAAFALLGTSLRGVRGMRFSAALSWCVCMVLVLYALLCAAAEKTRWAKAVLNVLRALLLAGFAVFVVMESMVLRDAHGTALPGGGEDVSCVIVLGAGVHGTTPSLSLSTRLDAALAFLADKPSLPIICSGGQGGGEDITEAECMARYLTARGIDPARIWKEERSTSTRTNFENSYALMAERGLDPTGPVAFVTSDFHICRARRIAGPEHTMGIASRLPGGAYYSALEFNYFIREAFALANELTFGVDL